MVASHLEAVHYRERGGVPGRRPAASRPLKMSKMMQPRSATAQSFHEPNHSRFGVPSTSQTMSQIRLAIQHSQLMRLQPAGVFVQATPL
jgi:hypothetical protein